MSHLSRTLLKVAQTVSRRMGNWTSRSIEQPPANIFNVLGHAKAIQAAALSEQLDGFEAACMRSEANRRAMQVVEVCAPPPTAERLNAVSLPAWLQSIRTTNVVFFLEGLPHTREFAVIFLPYNLMYESDFAKTLVHESIHVHQRLFRHDWNKIYGRIWDMRPWHGYLPAGLEVRRRFNPDTHMEPLFIWRGRFVPVMVFRRADAPRLREAHCVWYDTDTGGWEEVPPPGWMDFFGTNKPSHCEHPNEMAAYILTDDSHSSRAKMLLKDAVNSQF